MAVGKKIRFEVFKRDSFTCQYCGRSAPDIVLNLEHLKPQAKGGTDDILNLVTSCFDCNSGKSDRELSDDSVIQKRKSQLDQLQERREQLDMMMEWQTGLADLSGHAAVQVAEFWETLTDNQLTLTESGRQSIRTWIKTFSVQEVLDAMRTAADKYFEYGPSGLTKASVDHAYGVIPGICATERRSIEQPYLKDLYTIRKIARNKLDYINEQMIVPILQKAFESGVTNSQLRQVLSEAETYTRFQSRIWSLTESAIEHRNGRH